MQVDSSDQEGDEAGDVAEAELRGTEALHGCIHCVQMYMYVWGWALVHDKS
jgi:hypothetical protein